MGGRPFFRAGLIEEHVDNCIELAAIFKVDPFQYFDRPHHQIEFVLARAQRFFEAMRQRDGD